MPKTAHLNRFTEWIDLEFVERERTTREIIEKGTLHHLARSSLSNTVILLQELGVNQRLVFRELKSLYGLEKFQTSDPAIVELPVVAALLTLTISRALLGMLQEQLPEAVFPRESWVKIFRSIA